MTRHQRSSGLVLALALLGVGGAAAQAQTPPDLEDLVGARGAGGETQMQARGYQLVRATKVRDQSWTFWWSDVQRACVAISTSDGRYAAINRIPEQMWERTDADPTPRDIPTGCALTLICGVVAAVAVLEPARWGWQS